MFFGLFNNEESLDEQEKVPLEGTKLFFYSHLIKGLLSDHVQLLDVFGKINAAYQKENTKLTIKTLHQFRNLLDDHLIVEHSKLYVYLRATLADSTKEARIIRDFQKEMRGIDKVLNDFIDAFSHEKWSSEEYADFGRQLTNIGNVLISRIETEEESLFPLYHNPHDTSLPSTF
jgi:regulator of sigma D